jgi:hypothetical protein
MLLAAHSCTGSELAMLALSGKNKAEVSKLKYLEVFKES